MATMAPLNGDVPASQSPYGDRGDNGAICAINTNGESGDSMALLPFDGTPGCNIAIGSF